MVIIGILLFFIAIAVIFGSDAAQGCLFASLKLVGILILLAVLGVAAIVVFAD